MESTSNQTKRLIYFHGHQEQINSVLICQICEGYETFSKILLNGESATRTLLNLHNLHAVRGNCINGILDLDSSMSGPYHYFGYVNPFDSFTISINNSLPIYRQYQNDFNLSIINNHIDNKSKVLIEIPNKYITTISNYKWLNGKIYEKYINKFYNFLEQDTLFKNPGILEIENLELNICVLDNPLLYDLTKYRVKLINNRFPNKFNLQSIMEHKHAQHRLRAITYYYGKKYVNSYLMPGSGIFIEKHEFIQAITPLNSSCGGYIILGSENGDSLELIALQIPFGYTLLVEPWAIHGDSTMYGLYSMLMTGDHDAMNTADTVFIKNNNKANCKINFTDETKTSQIFNIDKTVCLLSSNKCNAKQLFTYDKILKANIENISYFGFQPVVLTPPSLFNWKTHGLTLPVC